MQATPQTPLLQVAVPLVGDGQGVQRLPQVCTLLFETHWPLQSWKPALQVKPHAPFTQVGVAFAGAGQGLQRLPQVDGLVSGTQLPEQAWKPG